MMTDTQELLADFVKNGSGSAFRELVTRYLDLVHSTAVRLVDGDTHRAEDIAQIVFADLARLAPKLSGRTTLGGWLHRHTCFVARTVMRGERRRQARERHAMEMNALNDPNDSLLMRIAPVLDEAIQELGTDDRDAILLRFFERRNLRSVGEALGVTENVAQKRVSRAVQELGILLQRRGVALSATALAGGLATGAATAAPAGLASGIAGSVFASAGATGAASLTSAKIAVMAKLKIGIVGAIIVTGAVTTILLRNQSKAGLRDETRPAQQQPDQPDRRSARPASQEIAKSSLQAAQVQPPQAAKPGADPVMQPTRQEVASRNSVPNEMVPLILNLPAPAFKGIPKGLQLDPNVEPLSDKPRAPMMVPPGLTNIAPGSKLTSSANNVSTESLAKITDGDKGSSEESIVFLRKGTQWVQMDLGSPKQIFALVIWHAHNAAKVYHDVIVQVAGAPDFTQDVRTLFNNDSDNSSGRGIGADREYIESYEGKLVNAQGVKARYIRFYSKGSTESALNEYTEIEVYGRPAQ